MSNISGCRYVTLRYGPGKQRSALMPNSIAKDEPQSPRVARLFWSPVADEELGVLGGVGKVRWIVRSIDLARVPQADAVEYLRENGFDGIFARLDHEGPILEFCRSSGVPIVDLAEAYPELNIPRVLPDEVAIGRMAGEHFVERGYRHFAFCSAYSHYALAGRLEGFREAVEPVSKTFHVIEARPGDEAVFPRPDAFARELEQLPLPLAVMAVDDAGAELVVDACEMAGLFVPEQVAVVGCNNSAICEVCRVRLSSIAVDFKRQGQRAGELLERLMAGEPPPAEPIRIAPITLGVRESSDIFAIENVTVARAVRHIIQRWRQGLQVEDVAAAVGVSRAYIQELFRRHLECGVAEYVRDMRIRQSKNMLLESSASIKEIAANAGFRQASHFSAVFRKATGLSPRAWRKQHRTCP